MRRRRKSKESLLELGLKLVFGGGALLVVPLLVGTNPIFDGVKTVLHLPGWVLLAVGLLVVALHLLTRKRHGTLAPAAATPRERRRADPRPTAADDQATARRILKTDNARVEPAFTPPTPATPTPTPTPAAPVLAPAHERLTHWSPEVFTAIEWRRFEAVCEALFAQAGFETRTQSHGADGGVDIWLHSRNANGPVAVVQCKHWQGKPVPVSAVREFFGVMASHKLARGTYVTSATFTADALAFAQANGINALDGTRLLAQIAYRTPAQQAELLKIAFEGEYGCPTCASCGVKMVERKSRNGGQRFWGCANYPRCKTTLPMARSATSAI